ncbi:MAG: MFS transporter [Clostridia bacterium]|nr:MFS transporter [Clostridia bacterium]
MSKEKVSFGERAKKAIGIEGDTKKVVFPMLNYTATNISTSGAGYFFSLYYIPFLVYVEGLSPSQVGLIILIKSIWDAITDPLMGVITDRTHSRFGKHRVYIIAAIVPFVVTFFMTWYSFGLSGHASSNAVMLYYIAAYVLYSTATTVLTVPHTAMLPEMAPDYFLRTQYNSVGYLMNSAGMVPTFILASLVLNFVRPAKLTVGSFFGSVLNCFTHSLDPDTVPKSHYLVVGLVLAAAYIIPLSITARKCKERSSLHDHFEPFNSTYAFREYALVFKNRAFRQYFIISILYMFATGFYNSSKIFLFKELSDTYFLYGIINIIAGICEASGFPLNYAITKKFGKQKCSWITTPFWIASLAIVLFITGPKTESGKWLNVVLILVHTVMYNFGLSGIGFTTSNTYPDITDVDEMIIGRRREGVIATFSTFIKKIASGMMGMFVLTGLEWFGVNTANSSSTTIRGSIAGGKHAYDIFGPFFDGTFGIKFFSAIVPLLCIIGSLLALRHFTMTKEQHTMIRAAIATKRKYGAVILSEKDKAACESIAGQKWENMWLSTVEEGGEAHLLEEPENGKYAILEEEKRKLEEEIEKSKASLL